MSKNLSIKSRPSVQIVSLILLIGSVWHPASNAAQSDVESVNIPDDRQAGTASGASSKLKDSLDRIKLSGMIAHSDPLKGTAIFETLTGASVFVNVGQLIAPHILLERVYERHIIVRNGQTEYFIGLTSGIVEQLSDEALKARGFSMTDIGNHHHIIMLLTEPDPTGNLRIDWPLNPAESLSEDS